MNMALPFLLASLLHCTVVDGDTLRCGAERVRLIGIDAPELPGHCRPGRHCAPGDGFESKRSLAHLVDGRPVRIERYGQDHYGRTLAVAWSGGINLACAQLRSGQAIYKPQWDTRDLIGRQCR